MLVSMLQTTPQEMPSVGKEQERIRIEMLVTPEFDRYKTYEDSHRSPKLPHDDMSNSLTVARAGTPPHNKSDPKELFF